MLFSIKYGAEPSGVQREVWFALGVMSLLHQQMFGSALVVTSMKDSQHMEKSLHGLGYAVDVRLRDLSTEQKIKFHDACAAAFDSHGFDLVIEGPHINTRPPHEHCEYDPKAGEKFLTFSE